MANGSLADARNRGIRLNLWIAILVAIALSLFVTFNISNASADTTNNVVMTVEDSAGQPLAGVTILAQGSYLYTVGTTDSTGTASANLPAGTYTFTAKLYGTTASYGPVSVSADSVTSYTFHTVKAQVNLQTCDGQGLAGASVQYKAGAYTYYLAPNDVQTFTDASGVSSAELFPGSYPITLSYAGSAAHATVDFGTTNPYTFTTTPVTLLNPGHFTYNVAGGYAFNYTGGTTIQLLPDTYIFHGNGTNFSVTAPANCTGFSGGVVRLVDHNGNGLAGGTASFYPPWTSLPGTTDSNGNLVFSAPSNLSAMAMYYQGTHVQQSLAELNASHFTFQTVLTTVKLEDADANALDTGSVSYYAGGWYTFGTGTTLNGQVTQEMLPGSYSFVMTYNHTRQQRDGVDNTQPVIFQTGRLSLYYSGTIEWYGSGWWTFAKPTMEFLPGTTTFYFNGYACQAPIDIASGDHLVKSMVEATLKNSSNANVAGGDASAYVGGWHSIGTTNSYGAACQLFDGQLGNVSVAMVYNGTRQQITQNQPTNSIYAFQTGNVTIELKNSTGALMDTGTASYYAGGWHDLGDTSGGKVAVEMLPGSYSFAMTYNGTRQQFNGQAVANGSTVVFQTTGVTVQLQRSTGENPPLSGGTASYYAGGWHTIGTTDDNGQTTVEMLPGSYSFAMTFNGTREQKNAVNVSGPTTNVTFQTVLVSVLLRTPDGQGPITDVDASASYYAGGWHTVTTNNGYAPFLMLPGNYSFAMVYKGTREQLNNVTVSGATTNVEFLTTQVHSDSVAANSYYAGGWQPFSQDMYLLPGNYWFHFNDGTPQTQETLTGGTTSNID
jgi:hypothetical protein